MEFSCPEWLSLPSCATTALLTGEMLEICKVHISARTSELSEHLMWWLPTMFAARSHGQIQRKSRSGYPEISAIAHLKKGLLFSQITGFGKGLWKSSLFPPERDNRDGPITVTNAVFLMFCYKIGPRLPLCKEKNRCKKTTIEQNIKIFFQGVGRTPFYCQTSGCFSVGCRMEYITNRTPKFLFKLKLSTWEHKKAELLWRVLACTVKKKCLISVLKMVCHLGFTSKAQASRTIIFESQWTLTPGHQDLNDFRFTETGQTKNIKMTDALKS